MSDTNTEQQQPTTPVAPSSQPQDTTDWERKYNGLQGQFKSEQEKAKTYAAKVTEITTQYEGQVNTLLKEKEDLQKQFQERSSTTEQLQKDYVTTKTELDALKIVLRDYADLAPLVAKGTLRINGLEGEALTQYLAQAREDLKGAIQANTQQNLQGASPQPPSGGATTMSLQEVSDKKLQVLRTQGAFSKEYQELSRLEDDLMRKQFGKPS